ncbi:MAG: hypothetical protein H6718_06090 [Polyangiaceae bacterium]|nr:hypothetical protein [Myxococcales bacterium]MCB9584947.1 hypothetical protein [Polyangiaceae bacterium]MCB9607480.1 hypothetical protein [Polyangiaceae bacterium]
MKVTILSVSQTTQPTIVEFSCCCGRASAEWHGPAPAAGDESYVELDAETVVPLRADAKRAAVEAPRLLEVNGRYLVRAELINVSPENEIVDLKLGDGSLTLEYDKTAGQPLRGWYELELRDLRLFDMGL